VKGRRYGEQGPAGAASREQRPRPPRLSVLLRLLAPFLRSSPKKCGRGWQDGSIHHARWPAVEEVESLLSDNSAGARDADQAAYDWATEVLFEVRKQRRKRSSR
jgi:valyl-tRNA synthetase